MPRKPKSALVILQEAVAKVQAERRSLEAERNRIDERLRELNAALSAAGAADAPDAPAKRGPGRPRKTAAATAAKAAGRKATAKAATPAKRGPGRPRKTAAAATPAKRGPGRPRKSPAPAATAQAQKATTAATPAKRGPGRPRKSPAPAAPARAAVHRKRRAAAKAPDKPKLEPRIEQYFAADASRQATAQQIGAALSADHRAVRLSLGRMAKKNKVTRLPDGSYRAYRG